MLLLNNYNSDNELATINKQVNKQINNNNNS